MNYFNLELDTTPPFIVITAPISAPKEAVIEIILMSQEPLGIFQEIYTIDAGGHRRNYIFNRVDANLLIGYISLRSYPFGFMEINATLKDEVLNQGNATPKIVNVIKKYTHSVEVFEIVRSPVAELSPFQIEAITTFKKGFAVAELLSTEIKIDLITRTPITKAVKL